jgi:asparagine synthase (glutamine-hydrolysing)
MHAGFMVVARGEEVELQLFGHDRPSRPCLVTCAAGLGCQAALMGRLYYRAELLARLREIHDQPEPPDDATLALAAYHAWGLEGIEQLEGDFALVIWDSRKRQLLASREAMGGYPVYWLQHGGTVAFATGLRPIVDLLPERSLNVDFLGELLMLPDFEIDYFEGTVFEKVRRLVPGWSIMADLARGSVKQHEFWKWPERIVDPGTDNLKEIGARYGELLRQAVRERLRGCMAAHFSGGMDSTSVALLAREELVREGRPLHALSMVYQNLANLGGETPFLDEALNRPGLISHKVPGDDILDFDVFREMPLHDEPIPGLQRVGVEMALLRAAAAVGADTVFSGSGADEMLAMRPFRIADLLRRGRLWAAWSEASRWARAENSSVWRILRPYGLAPLAPAWAQAGLGALLRKGYADWKHQNFWTIAPWVLPEFARRGRLRSRALSNVRRTFHAAPTVVQSEALGRIRAAVGDWGRYALAAPLGIVAAHPFRDLRVLSYGLGTRCRIRPEPGVQKPVLAEAMRDILPETIRRRRGKTHYNSVYYAGLSRNLPYLENMVRASRVDELGLFDKDCLLNCLNQAALCISSKHGVICLDNTLSIVKWLSLLPDWLAQRPDPVRLVRSSPGESSEPREAVGAQVP